MAQSIDLTYNVRLHAQISQASASYLRVFADDMVDRSVWAELAEEITKYMRAEMWRRFTLGYGPDRLFWPSLSPRTERHRKHEGYEQRRIFVRSGELRSSFSRLGATGYQEQITVGAGGLNIVSGSALPKAHWVQAIEPKRIIAGMGDEDISNINQMLQDFVFGMTASVPYGR